MNSFILPTKKDIRKKRGVYRISNSLDERVYIGEAVIATGVSSFVIRETCKKESHFNDRLGRYFIFKKDWKE